MAERQVENDGSKTSLVGQEVGTQNWSTTQYLSYVQVHIGVH